MVGAVKRISLTEDDLGFISGLFSTIEKQGYGLEIVRTCLETEALWIDGNHDLVILDMSLPDGSGYGPCRHIR